MSITRDGAMRPRAAPRHASVSRVVPAVLAVLACLACAAVALAAGPPYPDPVPGQVVYDEARVLSAETEAAATATIVAIEERTGAEIVVYTQLKPESDTPEEAERDAIALMDQWGVGRRGFDDGLVILFDLDESLVHGQAQLYAGPGYRAAFLSNAERQAVFEDVMLPLLRRGDLDGALLAALAEIDRNATPEHAASLERGRQLDAVLGLGVAPLALALLAGWALLSWWRFGRDPVYLDDPSILMPAPPPRLSAASAALVFDGRSSRRAFITALLDLASRGYVAFREESGTFKDKVGVEVSPSDAPSTRTRGRRPRPLTDAEEYLMERLRKLSTTEGSYLDPEELLKLAPHVARFEERLERHAVAQGWFGVPPGRVRTRWFVRGFVELIAGIGLAIVGISLPSAGLTLVGVAVVLAALVTLAVAPSMPARTMPGAVIRAMLAAYRRTLEKTLAQARSMKQVVDEAALPWLETPDQAMVWGVALGLHEAVAAVLRRSAEDGRRGGTAGWLPGWYGAGPSGGRGGATTATGGLAAGFFSSSHVPDFGGMMAALGTIGALPSSGSGGTGGGGFSGGSSGGGGGGAGGGF